MSSIRAESEEARIKVSHVSKVANSLGKDLPAMKIELEGGRKGTVYKTEPVWARDDEKS